MKHLFLIALSLLTLSVSAQTTDSIAGKETTEGFIFTTIDSVAITPVKDQYRSGTCWCFSGIAFLESEILRIHKVELDLSEMFVVNHTMMDRAVYYIRQHGIGSSFSPGGCAYDVFYCLKNYGMIPQEDMPGIQYAASKSDTLPEHTELDLVATAYVNALLSLKKLSPVWKNGLQAIYDTYLGACPMDFSFNDNLYTPITFADETAIDIDDYLYFTSYTHHPFYTEFALEIPDNWRMHQDWNLPIADIIDIIDNAIANGYTLIWAADISEPSFTKKGIGVIPNDEKGAELTGTDMDKWLGMKENERYDKLIKKPMPEKKITQAMRQKAYDNWETTDDHGMQIFGIAHDQNGKKYYMVKNSWGTHKSPYNGIWYVSEAYVRYKTNEIVVHKDAVPKGILKKIK